MLGKLKSRELLLSYKFQLFGGTTFILSLFKYANLSAFDLVKLVELFHVFGYLMTFQSAQQAL